MTQNTLKRIFNAAILAVDPCAAMLNAVKIENDTLQIAGTSYDLASFKRILVIGAGKATSRMALALETLLGSRITAGLIVVKDGHTLPLTHIETCEAAHPVPNQAGLDGTARILALLQHSDEKTLVICLLSGGASALMIAPADGISLQDKQLTTRLLLNAGAAIKELNTVRKHLSKVKGGRLAEAAFPATVLTLLISDVIGDPLDVIASGPTAADTTSYADAWETIEQYALHTALPTSVLNHVKNGCAGRLSETIKPGHPCLKKVQNVLITSNTQALTAAAALTAQHYTTRIVNTALQGEARLAAKTLAKIVQRELDEMQQGERRCLLCGGETTVTVRGNGMGGRNQEFALAFALEIAGIPGIALLSAGTDGSDGPTDATGAQVDGTTAIRALAAGINAQAFLDNNDSYHFFQQYDLATGETTHLKTGATGTNVMDIQIVLLEKPPAQSAGRLVQLGE